MEHIHRVFRIAGKSVSGKKYPQSVKNHTQLFHCCVSLWSRNKYSKNNLQHRWKCSLCTKTNQTQRFQECLRATITALLSSLSLSLHGNIGTTQNHSVRIQDEQNLGSALTRLRLTVYRKTETCDYRVPNEQRIMKCQEQTSLSLQICQFSSYFCPITTCPGRSFLQQAKLRFSLNKEENPTFDDVSHTSCSLREEKKNCSSFLNDCSLRRLFPLH